MAVRPVVKFGDPRLRVVTSLVDFSADDWRSDAEDLFDTLSYLRRTLGFGRALAGPQIGSLYRLIAFECDLGSFVAVNPKITWRSQKMVPVWDDCFSMPETAMAVMRHKSVSMSCQTMNGDELSFERLEPSTAEMVQHEIDHLDGILMMDHIVQPTAIISRDLIGKVDHPKLR